MIYYRERKEVSLASNRRQTIRLGFHSDIEFENDLTLDLSKVCMSIDEDNEI